MKFNEVLNKEYIMKAVRHCVDGAGCADCPYEFAPDCASIEELLCYIKELTEENERVRFISAHVCVGDVISTEEMKQMRMTHALPGQHGDPVGERGECGMKHNCMADTVRKFADYLKKHSFNCDPGNGFSFDAINIDDLDDYVKEFLEDEDE